MLNFILNYFYVLILDNTLFGRTEIKKLEAIDIRIWRNMIKTCWVDRKSMSRI